MIREVNRQMTRDGKFPPTEKEVTILFANLRGFTSMFETLSPGKTLEVLNAFIE